LLNKAIVSIYNMATLTRTCVANPWSQNPVIHRKWQNEATGSFPIQSVNPVPLIRTIIRALFT